MSGAAEQVVSHLVRAALEDRLTVAVVSAIECTRGVSERSLLDRRRADFKGIVSRLLASGMTPSVSAGSVPCGMAEDRLCLFRGVEPVGSVWLDVSLGADAMADWSPSMDGLPWFASVVATAEGLRDG